LNKSQQPLFECILIVASLASYLETRALLATVKIIIYIL